MRKGSQRSLCSPLAKLRLSVQWSAYICLPLLLGITSPIIFIERLENCAFASNFKLVIMNPND